MKYQPQSIELLLTRKSHPKLIAPAPSKAQLKVIFETALRAPDHAQLRPWRYRVFEGDNLAKLGEMFAHALAQQDPSVMAEKIERTRLKPMRAPMIIVASVCLVEHPKVPKHEQVLSAGASVQNLLMAAHFLNIGAMWRTGDLASNPYLYQQLGFEANEKLVGFIYLGTEDGNKREPKPVNIADFVRYPQ